MQPGALNGDNEEQTRLAQPAPRRLQSLDLLRGITVALMIVVNTSGDSKYTFRQLAHSKWNGCTLADVIFPCFLFMVGISCSLSIPGRLKRGVPRRTLVWQAMRRAALLFAFGLLVNTFPLFHLHTLRIFGVLQRIALCYLLAVLLVLFAKPRVLPWLSAALLVGYWIALRWIPVPHLGNPTHEIPFLDRYANLSAWIDRYLLPQNHLYRQSTYDPEGLLSTCSAFVNTIVGVLTGFLVKSHRSVKQIQNELAMISCAMIAAGLFWSVWFPLNKRLWTSSFALFTAGISMLAFWMLFRFVDGRGGDRPRWLGPAMVFGTNALPAYIFSECAENLLEAVHTASGETLHHWLFDRLASLVKNLPWAALVYALLFTAFCYLPIYWLYRRRIFLKI